MKKLFVAALSSLLACGSHASSQTAAVTPVKTAFGDPLPGLTAGELTSFQNGQVHFQEVEGIADGLGPVYNDNSCAACHIGPAAGGSNGRLETRFGRVAADGTFDPLISEGGSLKQDHGIGQVAGYDFEAESIPADANVIAGRRTTALYGLGLVDATPDQTFHDLAASQAKLSPQQAGTVAVVVNLLTGTNGVGKFGWKNVNPTLFQFAGDAYINEMGITSPLFTQESCPQGNCDALNWNPKPTMNDPDGIDVAGFTDFMTFLGPPPRGDESQQTDQGEQVFNQIGCAVCHVSTLQTGANASQALNNVEYHPYSDFLLHDMGALGDGITQNAANGKQMRTAPLWGMRGSTSLLHDGRAGTPTEAILAHDGQGLAARNRFSSLQQTDRAALLAFLSSL